MLRHLQDHLARRHDLAHLGPFLRDHAGGIGFEFRVAQLFFGGFQFGFRRIQLRFRRLQLAQGDFVVIGGYRPLCKQILLTSFISFRLVKSGSCRGNVGLRGVPGVSFDFGIQQRHRLPGLDHVADAHFSLDDPPANPEGEIDLVARAQMAGHDLWVFDLTFFNNDRADRAHHRRRLGLSFCMRPVS